MDKKWFHPKTGFLGQGDDHVRRTALLLQEHFPEDRSSFFCLCDGVFTFHVVATNENLPLLKEWVEKMNTGRRLPKGGYSTEGSTYQIRNLRNEGLCTDEAMYKRWKKSQRWAKMAVTHISDTDFSVLLRVSLVFDPFFDT